MNNSDKILNEYLEIMKHNADVFNNDMMRKIEQCTQMTKANLDKLIPLINDTINQNDKASEGVLIDFKTYSELVNVLSYGKSVGTVNEDFFNKVLNIGKEQHEPSKKKSDEEKIADEIQRFLMARGYRL